MNEPDILIHHREELAELLTEAAEVEHNLMCCYLFAAWSLKTAADGLSEAQAARVAAWRRAVTAVAIDEMAHLALANNLLVATGAAPHVGRPNFPIAPGYHPAGVVVQLRRFERSTLDHFVFLERPEGVDLPDGEGYGGSSSYHRAMRPDVLMPSAQDFATVGHLYRGIQAGLARLADQLGERALFVGDPAAQLGPPSVELNGLIAVTDLASALQAVDNIVTQGEGNALDAEDSHYRRFCRIRDDYVAFLEEHPTVDPARRVVRNPVQRRPPTPDGKVWVGAPDAAQVLDLSNALYNHMLRLLGASYAAGTAEIRSALVGEAIGLMQALVPLNEVLTRLPADEAAPDAMAGSSFAVTREIRVPPPGVALQVLVERTWSLADGARRVGAIDPAIGAVADSVAAAAERLERLRAR